MLALIAPISLIAAPLNAAPREKISINADWRFQQGDSEGTASYLMYDVRPEVVKSADGKAADAEPEKAERVAGGPQTVLKGWILPTGNAFIKDPAKRYTRPANEPAGDIPYTKAGFNDSGWSRVNLPHDWAIAGPFLKDGPYGGMGRLKTWGPVWYRKALSIPANDKGKSIFLDVDGAMSYATVWLNGKIVGGWPYGYNSWRVDLTAFAIPGGKNELAIRLDNPPESARWYPGAGLYRNVWLTKTNAVHVGQWGTHITTTDVSKASAKVNIEVSVDNQSGAATSVDVATQIYAIDGSDKKLGGPVATFKSETLSFAASASAVAKGTLTIDKPRLWGPPPTQTPNRYVAVTTLTRKGKIVDRYETPFGIRSIRFDGNTGLYVNDEPIRIKGVNNHHDLGALGAAFNVRAAERQLDMLQDMGANALRMSHNPPAPELLELTDKKGILVIDEVFDSWERKKTPLDFHLIFPDWHEQDLRAMLRRDRNNPSIIIWSVGNEVGEQYTGEEGANISHKLVAIAKEEDPTRPTMTAMNYAKSDMPLPGTVDVISLNYQGAGIRAAPGQFPFFHAKFPDKAILSSESAAALSSRGEYQFPVPGTNSAPVRPGVGGDPKSGQVSAYELFAADFGSSADRSWAADDQNPYVAGEFVWTGFDYLGEPTPYYTSRSSYFGIIDLAGFKKDRYWLYQSRWRPDLAMAHILPHWTWPGREGEVTPVHVFTSGDEAELFINGKSQGRKKRNPYEYRFRWDYTTYEPGEVSVVVYKNGKEWAKDSVKTASAATNLVAETDRKAIKADGLDLAFITVSLKDKDGNTAPRANDRITFSIDGPGEIVATDNGDPTDMEAFPSTTRKAFNGLALVIVKAKPGKAGKITVRAEAASLTGTSVQVRSF